jgi:hypothetical protein
MFLFGCEDILADETEYDQTGNDISFKFKKFMKYNSEIAPDLLVKLDPESNEYLLDQNALNNLKKYHFLLLPGGDFDAFSELYGFCTGQQSPGLEEFIEKNPAEGKALEEFFLKDVCPSFDNGIENYYSAVMGAFKSYEHFFKKEGISYTRLDFFHNHEPKYAGDRGDKLDLIAETIDEVEADYENDNASANIQYVLIGHSFGGLNICDFLVELINGHGNDTPEGKIFKDTLVRSWPADKKERIFNQIKGAVFVNTFVQGDKSSETNLKEIAGEEGITDPDPVGFAIELVLEKYITEMDPKTLLGNKILHFVLRTQRYRLNYYLKDKNTPTGEGQPNIQNAFDRIAGTKAIISICCKVPKILPDLRVGTNFLVHSAKNKWKNENTPNDGAADTYSAIFPRQATDYVVLKNMDHGTILMKPDVPGITMGWDYDQMPFIKTLLKRVEVKLNALQE